LSIETEGYYGFISGVEDKLEGMSECVSSGGVGTGMPKAFGRAVEAVSGAVAGVEYEPSFSCDTTGENQWKNVFYTVLNERREKDITMGYSSVGPHRDEVRFLLGKKPAKTFGSQGQCRSLALSLKLSSVSCIERYRNDKMIFLVDDAVSELDSQRTSRAYPLIEGKGQVFIATPSMTVPLSRPLLHCAVSRGTATAV